MSKVAVTKSKLDNLASSISTKSGESLPLTLDEMKTAVDGIQTGGITPTGNINITQSGTTDVTNYATATVPSATISSQSVALEGDEFALSVSNSGLVTADVLTTSIISPITADGFVETTDTVSVGISGQTTSQLTTQSATTITPTTSSQTAVPAYRWTTGAVTVAAMPTGTTGTPTATKGTVSNHSVSVTPSVTNTTGYITGGTKTGTAVSVSASELVSGSQTITENSTVDVTNLAEVVVNVSGGGGGSVQTATSTATLSSASYSISFTGLSGNPTSFAVTASDDQSVGTIAVVYDGSNLHGQTLASSGYSTSVTYDGSGFSKTYSNGTLTITGTTQFQTGQYALVYSYDGSSANIGTASVQVGSGATSISFTGLTENPSFWSCIFKSNFDSSSGYQRVIDVVGHGSSIYGNAMDSSAHSASSWTASYSNGTFTVASQGTNVGGYFHQPGYYQLTYVVGEEVYQTYYTGSTNPSSSLGIDGDIYLKVVS